MECGGVWRKSQLYINCQYTSRSKRKAVRKWLTKQEVIAKFGEESGLAIIERKLNDPELKARETRPHPENPEDENLFQFLVLDLDEYVEEEEDVMQQLYTVAEGSSDDSSSSSNAKKKKDKKNKGKKDKKRKKKAIKL